MMFARSQLVLTFDETVVPSKNMKEFTMRPSILVPEQITSIKHALEKNGYWHGAIGAINDGELLKFCEEFGQLSMSSRQVDYIKSIRPVLASQAPQNTLSSRYGTDAFPFHTDAAHWRNPAKYIFLYCICPGSGNRKTLLIDLSTAQFSSNDRSVLRREVWSVYGIANPFLCTVESTCGAEILYRYDLACMKPSLPTHAEAADIMGRFVQDADQTEVCWQTGELLIIDNHRMLHARGSAVTSDLDRHHKRVLTVCK